jgi:hypothetical protein
LQEVNKEMIYEKQFKEWNGKKDDYIANALEGKIKELYEEFK